MNTVAKKFNSEQVQFLDLFLKVDQRELDEYDDNLYYSLFQTTSDKPRCHMDWIKSSRSYDCIPDNFEEDSDIYFGVNLAHTQPLSNRTNNQAVARVAALYADFDGKDLVDAESDQYKALAEECYTEIVELRQQVGENTGKSATKGMRQSADRAARSRIFKANRQHYLDMLLPKIVENTKDLPPSLIVFTGGGYHCYWLLNNAKYLITPEDRAACIEAQENFVLALDGDEAATDIARVLRVLGTTNTKYEDNNTVTWVKKDVDVRYSFEQLATFANNSASAKAKRAKRSSGAGKQNKPNYMHEMPDLDQAKKGKFTTIPKATMAQLHKLYPSPLNVFQHLGLFTSETELHDEGAEWRIPNYGGLLVVKEGEAAFGSWHCHGEGYGGDIVYAWLWAKDGIYLPTQKGAWSVEDNKHWVNAVCELLNEQDVELDYDYNIFYTNADTAKRMKEFFESDNPRSLYKTHDEYQKMCAVVTNNRAKKYGRNAESKLKLGDEFPLYRLSEMRTYDIEKDEVIERLAYRGQVSLFFAPPDTGKSYLAVEIAVSLMLGKSVAEQLSVRPRTSSVLYIAAETDPDFKNRTVRAALKFNVSEGRLESLLNYFDGDALKFRLDDADWINRFAATYLHRFESKRELPDLIIIDTLRTAINGGGINENDNMEMSRVIGNAKLLCKALGNAACLLIHHTNRGNEEFAGAGSLEGDCHIVLRAQADKDNGTLAVYCRKNKLMKIDRNVPILAVKFVSSGDGAILQPYDKSKVARKQDGLNDNQRRVLQVIYDECKANRPPKYKTFGDLLAERYNEPIGTTWINRRKELAITPLVGKKLIELTGEFKDKATTLLITAKGKQYIESSGVTEEDLPDDSAEKQEASD